MPVSLTSLANKQTNKMGDSDSDDLLDLLEQEEGEESEQEREEEVSEEEREDDGPWLETGSLSDGEERDGAEQDQDQEQEASSSKLEEVPPTSPSTCLLCHQPQPTDLRLGTMYSLEGISAHHFCLILASGLQQVWYSLGLNHIN